MFFLDASFFRASYNADGILIFNALSFTFSPPLQFYYNYCCVSTVIFHNLSRLFLLLLPVPPVRNNTERRVFMPIWNPWHGCTKYSAGCQNCYVYRIDATHGHNSTTVQKTAAFSLPMQRTRGGTLKLQPTGEPVYTCLSSDFFLAAADDWRTDIWAMIRFRSDLQFLLTPNALCVRLPAFRPTGERATPM